ncbi:MAG: zinc-dependent metalloprotease [Actinobacteria bacterium]|nr:zinc-dependent metalloprotease [Actinomycetota bacterium]
MTELISWEIASKVANAVSGYFPDPPKSEMSGLESDLNAVFPDAQAQVAKATGLVVPGNASPLVMSRPEWVEANLSSFRQTLAPLLENLSKKSNKWPLTGVSAAIAGAQLGTILGWMSSKVLGQFDVILADANSDLDVDQVYFVGPNIISVEMKYGFDQKQFRHWISLHELTHRAQFNGVSWMRDYFKGLVEESISFANPDPAALMAGLKRVFEQIREGRNPLDDNGPIGIFATSEQLVSLNKITGLMSLLEGHGDIVMNRAGADDIVESNRFAAVLSQRRSSQRGISKLMSQLLGMDAKMRQYQEGEVFVERVEQAGGMELFNKVWENPENLPSAEEIRNPEKWIDRMTVSNNR